MPIGPLICVGFCASYINAPLHGLVSRYPNSNEEKVKKKNKKIKNHKNSIRAHTKTPKRSEDYLWWMYAVEIAHEKFDGNQFSYSFIKSFGLKHPHNSYYIFLIVVFFSKLIWMQLMMWIAGWNQWMEKHIYFNEIIDVNSKISVLLLPLILKRFVKIIAYGKSNLNTALARGLRNCMQHIAY